MRKDLRFSNQLPRNGLGKVWRLLGCSALLFFFIGLVPASSFAHGQFVQWTSGDAGATTVSTTYLNNVTAGNLLVVLSHWDNQTITASVTDQAGDTFVPITGPLSSGNSGRFQAWYAKKITGRSSLGVTVTYSAKTTSFSVVDAAEYSGLDTSAPLDVAASSTGRGTSQNSGPSPATTSADDTIIGFFGYDGYASLYKAGTGFTFRNYDASTMLEDMTVTAVGSYNATATSANSANWAAIVIGFKNAGGQVARH